VNLVTKSGSNGVHGDAFEFNRDRRFIERATTSRRRKTISAASVWRGTLGAPIVKNKLFLFGGYQGRIEKEQPADGHQLRADRGDAGWRFHRVRPRRPATARHARTY
jgi:hypothetical protein